jgi:hemolysin-activating ACP:hemolysin acyltransferase
LNNSFVRSFNCFYKNEADNRDLAVATGNAVLSIQSSGARISEEVFTFSCRFRAAHQHGMATNLFDEDSNPAGYFLSARLDSRAVNRIRKSKDLSLHHSEWRSGDDLWIIHTVIGAGRLKHLVSFLRDHHFQNEARITYARKKGAVFKVVTVERKRLKGLFRDAPTFVKSCRCGSPNCGNFSLTGESDASPLQY